MKYFVIIFGMLLIYSLCIEYFKFKKEIEKEKMQKLEDIEQFKHRNG